MNQPPGPLSESEVLPPPPSAHDQSPPGPGEVHENDVLKRRRVFSWKQFGGDGFLISVAFHVILLLLGLFYVIQKYTEPKKPDTDVFATGAGGGANGDKAKQFEHKMQRKVVTPLKTPSRIVSKSANASIALPSTPSTSTASFSSGLSAGGMSKGMGGGSGGGEGAGIGIGKGGGRNFVSLFGSVGRADRLTGYIYDFTQTRAGKPNSNKSRYSRSDNMPWLRPLVTSFVEGGWRLGDLDKYFRGPVELGVHQILIPRSVDSAAPKAFEADGKMEGSAWIAVYRGKVRSPESGEIRFSGTADNFLGLRFNGKNVLLYDCGSKDKSPMGPVPGIRQPIATGKWIRVNKGEWYDMNILIGDGGGLFSALLYYERKGAEGRKVLFHTESLPWGDVMALDKGDLPRDLDPDSPVWQCKTPAPSFR